MVMVSQGFDILRAVLFWAAVSSWQIKRVVTALPVSFTSSQTTSRAWWWQSKYPTFSTFFFFCFKRYKIIINRNAMLREQQRGREREREEEEQILNLQKIKTKREWSIRLKTNIKLKMIQTERHLCKSLVGFCFFFGFWALWIKKDR